MQVAASLISPWLLWWPPAESHYNISDHSAVSYVSHTHCIVLLYSVGNKTTTTATATVSASASATATATTTTTTRRSTAGSITVWGVGIQWSITQVYQAGMGS